VTVTLSSIARRLEKAEVATTASDERIEWQPLPGPQTLAYTSSADVIGYGGAAGGGKTDLAVGKALTQHSKVLILRREATQLVGIIDRFTELLGGREGFNGTERIWRLPGQQFEFGSTPSLDDWQKYQGRPHDLLVFDEAANFLEAQVRALLGWVRSVDPEQRCQALLTFNPPTNVEGRWIVSFFGPWLDPLHPNPAKDGELRFFAMVDGKEIECADGTPFELNGERIQPQSRTFIAARLADNPHLVKTGYMATLQALPEPLRSQMLRGDFSAGMEDDAQQVIPTAWVDAAMDRWRPRAEKGDMTSMGVDVARGGKDSTVIACRHGMWFDTPKVYPGTQTPDGPTVAGLVVAQRRDSAPIHIDVIGVGSSPYDTLKGMGLDVLGVNVAEKALGMDQSGRLTFFNQRSELVWLMREALDPANDTGIALPPDKRLRADLCAFTWEVRGTSIFVHSREQIISRIGRSPDWASAFVLALKDTPKRAVMDRFTREERERARRARLDYIEDPFVPAPHGRKEHDPFAYL
jgi:hypothetical protein